MRAMTHAARDRAVFAALAVVAFAACALAYGLQHGDAGLLPCPYCVLQRYAYAAIILAAIAGASDPRHARIHATLACVAAVAGAALAGWQIVHGASMTSCRVDPVGELVNGLPMAAWWPQFLAAEGSCADARAAVLGVPIPIASLGTFAALFAAAAWRTISRRAPGPDREPAARKGGE